MSKFRKSLAIFLAGVPYLSAKGNLEPVDINSADKQSRSLDPVDLRPLNVPANNLFAAHRSHSSHASHRSSSGGGSYTAPTPMPSPPSTSSSSSSKSTAGTSLYSEPGSARPVDPGRPAAVSPAPAQQSTPQLTRDEKLRIQVMRVQIALASTGLYSGAVDGVLGPDTKEALKRFQIIKGIQADGLMNTPTLNALGVPAVQ